MRFVTWCIVKLDFYVTLCSACRILIVANYISHMGIKMISWLWVVGDVYTTECRLGMRFVTWRIFKLYCHVNLCITFHILIVSNYISHLGIKVISWSWVFGDVTNTPDFSDHIQVNCLFFTREKLCSLKATRSSKSAFLITGYQMY